MGQIIIDISDWEDAVKREEVTVASIEDIIDLIRKGAKTGDVAITGLISQHLGTLEDEGFRQPKENLYYGAQQNILSLVRARNKKVKINDLTLTYHEFIGPNGDGSGAYVESTSARGVERARKNLQEQIPRYITNQALILREAGQDYGAELEQLKIKIDEIAMRLSEPLSSVPPKKAVRAKGRV